MRTLGPLGGRDASLHSFCNAFVTTIAEDAENLRHSVGVFLLPPHECSALRLAFSYFEKLPEVAVFEGNS